mgnify:CR=1 FL=1
MPYDILESDVYASNPTFPSPPPTIYLSVMIIYILLKLVLKCTVVCCANGVACSTLCVKDICRTFMSKIWKHILLIYSDFIPILLEFYFTVQGKDYRAQFQLGNGALFGANYIQVYDTCNLCQRT